jgi:hypothetical protein
MKTHPILREMAGSCVASAVAVLAATALLTAWPAAAQTKTDAEKLADAIKEINALKARLSELEGTVKALAQPKPPTSAAAPTPATMPKLDDKGGDSGFVKWNELAAGKSKFKLYGFLRLDAIYDDSRPNGNGANSSLVPAFIGSENGLGGAANLSPGPNHENFVIHPRLTRFGLDFTGPEIDSLWGAKTGGKFEIDFYNLVPGGAESREFLRMRHAYLTLKWDQASLLAGQSADLISQYWPVINPDFGGMWGAGNLGDRRPQLRLEYTPKIGPGNLLVQGAAGLTGADDNRDLDANGIRDGEASGLPTFQGRLGYRFPVWEKQNLEIAGWIHHAREKLDIAVAGRNNFTSQGYGLDLSAPLYKDIVSLKGELWTGKNLDDVRGGILQGINLTSGREIHAEGGWLELTTKPCRYFSFHSGYMFDDPHNNDLPATGPSRNTVWYLAGRFYFDPVEFGLDYLNWTTYFKDPLGRGKGDDNRFQAFISYKF